MAAPPLVSLLFEVHVPRPPTRHQLMYPSLAPPPQRYIHHIHMHQPIHRQLLSSLSNGLRRPASPSQPSYPSLSPNTYTLTPKLLLNLIKCRIHPTNLQLPIINITPQCLTYRRNTSMLSLTSSPITRHTPRLKTSRRQMPLPNMDIPSAPSPRIPLPQPIT